MLAAGLSPHLPGVGWRKHPSSVLAHRGVLVQGGGVEGREAWAAMPGTDARSLPTMYRGPLPTPRLGIWVEWEWREGRIDWIKKVASLELFLRPPAHAPNTVGGKAS